MFQNFFLLNSQVTCHILQYTIQGAYLQILMPGNGYVVGILTTGAG